MKYTGILAPLITGLPPITLGSTTILLLAPADNLYQHIIMTWRLIQPIIIDPVMS
jgi:hypothetical protein